MFNIVVFDSCKESIKHDIVYAIIDRTSSADNSWSKEISKNISDYTIQDLTNSGYTVVVSVDEESILKYLSTTEFKHVVVISTGTEFVFDPINSPEFNLNENGDSFTNQIKKFCQANNFFLAGHILDREESYYELHHQCYVLNLDIYKKFNCPEIGQIEYHVVHEQIEPLRSKKSFHHNHTPLYIKPGNKVKKYKNKCHGWNI